MAATNPDYDLKTWRAQIPLLATHVLMNNCSHAPQTVSTRAAATGYLDSWNTRGMDWERWLEEVQRARELFAGLINASVDEIAVVASVSAAASAVASALDFSGARKTVVASEAEFPTVGHVWLAQQPRGANIHWVPLVDGTIHDVAYEACIDSQTVIVSACHGYYLNGGTHNLRALSERAHAHGALVFVDAYQTIGAVPIDVKAMDVDFLASGNLKYLMGVPGIAFLYVRRELLAQLTPTVTGWFGRVSPYDFTLKQLDWSATASRFDTGTPPLINAYIVRAGMDIIRTIGVSAIRSWNEVLGQHLMDGGRERGLKLHGPDNMAVRTANTAFLVADAGAVERAMRTHGVLAAARGPVIRLAPHFYNTLEDCDTALDVLAAVVNA